MEWIIPGLYFFKMHGKILFRKKKNHNPPPQLKLFFYWHHNYVFAKVVTSFLSKVEAKVFITS